MTTIDEGLLAQLAAIEGVDVRIDVPAGPLCTYRVGGLLQTLVDVASLDALVALSELIGSRALPTLVVGRGSNLLVADAGFGGVAIRLGAAFAGVEIDGCTVRAGGAAALPVVARTTAAAGLTGFEWAVGVPGTIGGAVRMNAGGHGSDMAATLVSAEIVDMVAGGASTRPVGSLALGYRRSNIAPTDVVAFATLELEPGDPDAAAELISDIVGWRREHQPGGANAGSVFTNPPGDSAGRLIDTAGLKGLRVGTAEVSDKHANFIQAEPGGSADDVLRLMVEITERVEAVHGIRLQAETRLIGFPASVVAQVQHPTDGAGETQGSDSP